MLPTKAMREKIRIKAPTRLLSRSRCWGRILTQNRLETSLEKSQTRGRLRGPTCSLFMCVLLRDFNICMANFELDAVLNGGGNHPG